MYLIEHLVAVAENLRCDMVCIERVDDATFVTFGNESEWARSQQVIARNSHTDVWELFRRNDAGGYDYVAPACEDDADKVRE